ncbi:DUF1254 domain-containing protein [Aureimonas populi]|uniref:DUF1254 domain-containing protein n=1 Tax=Aureimonas populi TaxID=1701758 RepID=A0ABW5CM12_9HYPH|nr:hypothetical protein [Aureimonas populi]
MGKVLLALLVGLVGAAIVHIAVILAMPRVAEDNAWARLSRVTSPFQAAVIWEGGGLPAAGPMRARFAFMDPAFITSACRFPLADGPVHLEAGEAAGFWSASLYARSGDNLYSINERLAPDGQLDLVVGTAAQLEDARAEGLLGDDGAIPIGVEASELYLTLRVLAPTASERPFAERFARSLSCIPVEPAAAAPLAEAD